MPSLGLVMILLNEEKNLERSLAPVAGLFDEVVVVDTGSVDSTREIARSMGASVHKFKWAQDFSQARNFSISKASADYLFWLDGDNEITPAGVARLRQALENEEGDFVGWAREILEPRGGSLIQKRLFPRRPEVHFQGRIHEQLAHPKGYRFVYLDVDIRHWGYADPAAARAKALRNLGLIRESLKSSPGDFFLNYQAGKTLFNLKRYGQALESLNQALDSEQGLEENPELAGHAAVLQGLALERLGKPSARAAFETLIESGSPGRKIARFHLGRLLSEAGEDHGAIENLKGFLDSSEKYLTLDLDLQRMDFQALLLLARLHQGRGESERCLTCLSQAIRLEPDTGFPYRELIKELVALGRTREAGRILKVLGETLPKDRALPGLKQLVAGAGG